MKQQCKLKNANCKFQICNLQFALCIMQFSIMLRYLFIDIPARRRALVIWSILALAVCIKTALMGGECSVYRMFAGAARHWWIDQSLYGGYTVTERLDGFRYSPTFAVLFSLFYWLPGQCGAIAWSLVSIAALVWAMHVLVRDVLPGDWSPSREGWFLGLVMVGSIVGLWALQSNAVVTALICLALAAIARQRWWTAAVWLAVAVFIKLWPIAIVLLLISCWPQRKRGQVQFVRSTRWAVPANWTCPLFRRFLPICAILAMIPFLTRPPGIVAWQYREWYAALTGPFQGRWPGYRDAWTIWEQLCPLFGVEANWQQPTQRHVYTAIQLLTAVAVLGWCLWQRRRIAVSGGADIPVCPASSDSRGRQECLPHCGEQYRTGHLLTLILSMWAAWQLLFGPGTEQLTYGIIAPSASWAVLVSFAEKRARWLTTTTWAMLALLPSGDIEQAACAIIPGGKALLPLGVAMFVAWLVWHEKMLNDE
jgi:alpha-1,2-mannosyltransferase